MLLDNKAEYHQHSRCCDLPSWKNASSAPSNSTAGAWCRQEKNG